MRIGFIASALLTCLVVSGPATGFAESTGIADSAEDSCYTSCHRVYIREVVYCARLHEQDLQEHSYIPLVAYLQGYSQAVIDIADAEFQSCRAKAGKRKADCEILCANQAIDRANDRLYAVEKDAGLGSRVR